TIKEKTAKPLFKTKTSQNRKKDVVLKSFRWVDGPTKPVKQNTSSAVKKDPVTYAELKTNRFLGLKIDLSGKISQMKESYMQNIRQSRSHNFFLSKYALFKVSALGQILSMLGVPQEELIKLQKKALNSAIQENLELMSENIYNLELSQLFFGYSRKARRSQRMFHKVQLQLMEQLSKLGKPYYWTKARLYEERIRQCRRIEDELTNEKHHLEYQLSYIEQRIEQ
ncbi:hypothetical protein ACFL96_10420, partial [Thermoproteota archaeon]